MAGTCSFVKGNGERCRAAALHGSDLCYWHSPAVAKERGEARRLGGLRRKREKATAQIFDWSGLGEAKGMQRILEVAITDTLGLENSPARSRTLGYLVSLSAKVLELGGVEERLSALERIHPKGSHEELGVDSETREGAVLEVKGRGNGGGRNGS